MIYGYGGRVDNDSNAITVIDEENRTAETKGYINGEYVEFSGGGGSSDFSTVTVTVINNSSNGVTMSGAFFDEGAVYGTVYGEELSAPGTQEMSLIVYKNASSELYFDLGTTIITTITGDATKRGDAYVDVTGDCTITIS